VRLFRASALICFLALGASVAAQSPAPREAAPVSLRAGFENPPQTAKLRCYWWWINNFTTEDTITRELTAMKQKGYAGVILVNDYANADHTGQERSPEGPNYGTPAWMKLYLHALQVAKQLGLEISLSITDGGNVGILGGPGVGPEDALKFITYSRTDVSAGSSSTIHLPAPPAEANFYRQIAVLAYPLRHGAPLPGDPGSNRAAIRALIYKTTVREPRGDMWVPSQYLLNDPSVPGEQDTDHADVRDLTSLTSADGTLHWTVPPGQWEILRVGYTATHMRVTIPLGSGYALNALSAQAFDHYWDRVLTPILATSKPYIGTSLKYLVTDSWEAGGANWSEDFRQQFERRRGYDPVPYLAVFAGRIVDSRDVSNRFLSDVRRTDADLIAENYYDRFAARAAAYGLGTHPEAGGPHEPPIDSLENFRHSAFPQTEFWAASPIHRTTDADRFFVKEAASAAHIYGKRYVAAESFSTINMPWSNSPGHNLKPALDRAITEGLNRIFWHEFTSSPSEYGKPGIEYFADTHLDPNVTWWPQAAPVLLALNRAQFLLQQGEPVIDLLYYYGSEVPNFSPLKSFDPARVLPGYDYDVTNQDALLHRMQFTGGSLHTPEGIRYRALALPTTRRLDLSDLLWVEKFVRSGGVVIGLQPTEPEGLIPAAQMAEYQRLAARLWSGCAEGSSVRYGQGTIYCTQNAHAALTAMHVTPDFTYRSSDAAASFDFVHRRTASADIYFVRNARDVATSATFLFRVTGRAPVAYNMATGAITPLLVYRAVGDQTEVPLSIPAQGSFFLVFQRSAARHAVDLACNGSAVFPSMQPGIGIFAAASPAPSLQSESSAACTLTFPDGSKQSVAPSATSETPQLGSSWTINFPSGWGAPPSVTMTSLQSWTDSPDPGVRYFSGTATYHNTIQVPASLLAPGHAIWLNLGDVREVATVTVNGKQLRTVWYPPYLVRIDSALHPGVNQLSIDVTNLWPNRLIGDLQPGAKRYAKTNIHAYQPDSPLLPSGLLAPVRVYSVAQTPVHSE
jgi:(4-O-methyl)-D-glucuronate---lignin esterase